MIANKQTDTQTHMPHISVGQQKKFNPPPYRLLRYIKNKRLLQCVFHSHWLVKNKIAESNFSWNI